MFLTIDKLQARIKELEPYRYRDLKMVPHFEAQLDEAGEVGARPPAGGKWRRMQVGDQWKGRDRYLWLRTTVSIPETWEGRKVVGLFDFGRTGSGNVRGFESLLYLNGRPYQGVDQNHQEVLFPEDAPGTEVKLSFRLWSGMEGGGRPQTQTHRIERAAVGWLDEAADDLYFTARTALETILVLDEQREEHHLLVGILSRTFRGVDWADPGSDDYYRSVEEARRLLREELAAHRTRSQVTVRCLGHAHIDVAWLWRLKHTREKSARSFSTVLRLMEQFPEYIFFQSQPQLYDYMKQDYPDLYNQIRERIREGRWEAGGAMWLEADCNLPSGESLVRQILYGTQFLRQEFGVECRYLWLPDAFGYSYALPQIMRKSGIETLLTTKLSWNQYNRMPNDTFYWRGLDGSEVVAHFITTPDMGSGWYYTYNGSVNPYYVEGIWRNYRNKSLNRELLLAYGYGDGGGGVNREMLETRRRVDEMLGLPRVRPGRADEYFDQLHQTLSDSDEYIQTWDGELYLELHRGTFTSQAWNKRMNRKLELLYRHTEWLAVLNSLHLADWSRYPFDTLKEGWTIILRNQFHDIIPGSSIREVYEDSLQEYEEAQRLADRIWSEAVADLKQLPQPDGDPLVSERTAASGIFTLFNDSTWERTDLVELPAPIDDESAFWQDGAGKLLPSQKNGENWLVLVSGLPPMGYATISCEPSRARREESDMDETVPFHYQETGIRTPYYEIDWNEAGQLVRVVDLETNRQVLAPESRGNLLQVFEDKPLRHDAWDIDLFYQEKMEEITTLDGCELVEVGPLRAIVQFRWRYRESTVLQRMILYRHSRRIDFETEVEWYQRQQLLKVAFPVNIRATEATFDIQFGNMKRPTHWNTAWDAARFETVGHQWVDLSERGYGVSLLNDCKYGHDVKDNLIRLSLIKSSIRPDYTADQGHHSFTYSLYPHAGDWFTGRTVQEAWFLNNEVRWVHGKVEAAPFSLFQVLSDHVVIDAVKKAEGAAGVILRIHEYAGARGTVKILSDYPILAWQEVNLLEQATEETSLIHQPDIEMEIKPYEIKTLFVRFGEGTAGS